MSVQIYTVKPKAGVHSRMWRADEDGVAYLKEYYSNYAGKGIDRWDDFIVRKERVNAIHIDFGGAIYIETPLIEINIDGVIFTFLSHQAEGVYSCIKGESYKGSGVWRINGRWVSNVIGPELRDKFYVVAKDKIDSWNKQFSDFEEIVRENLKKDKGGE